MGQIDSQLTKSADYVLRTLGQPGQPFNGASGSITSLVVTPGTVATALNAKGQLLVPWTSPLGSPVSSVPIFSFSLAKQASGAPIYTTVPGTRGVRYRLLLGSICFKNADGTCVKTGNLLAEAIPLTGTDATLHRLLVLELLVSGAVLIALAGATWLIIRLSLRPLQKMADTAGEIAAGDLSQRVEQTDNRTEVGRLGNALNVMLGRIEAAFREREASESRLRRFVADASHELRTPLTSIRGYAELFQHGLADRPADLDTAMRRIDSESTRMAGLVDDLLLLARLDQGRPLEQEPVDLSTLAADAAQDARVIDPSRTVRFEAPASCPIIGDESRLRQLLGNLVSNALAYTPAGSPFEVVVTRLPSEDGAAARPGSPSSITAPGSRPRAPSTSSSASGDRTPPGCAPMAAPAWDCRSSRPSPMHTAGVSRWRRRRGGGATFAVDLPAEPDADVSKQWGLEGFPMIEPPTGNGTEAARHSSFAGGASSAERRPPPEAGCPGSAHRSLGRQDAALIGSAA